jgi:hypothetical protein
LPLLESAVAGLVRTVSRRQIMPWRPGPQHPQHAVQHLPCISPGSAPVVGTALLSKLNQESDLFPLHVREIHTLDLLQFRSRIKLLFTRYVYEIASKYLAKPEIKNANRNLQMA